MTVQKTMITILNVLDLQVKQMKLKLIFIRKVLCFYQSDGSVDPISFWTSRIRLSEVRIRVSLCKLRI
jgi:hypothetical protein